MCHGFQLIYFTRSFLLVRCWRFYLSTAQFWLLRFTHSYVDDKFVKLERFTSQEGVEPEGTWCCLSSRLDFITLCSFFKIEFNGFTEFLASDANKFTWENSSGFTWIDKLPVSHLSSDKEYCVFHVVLVPLFEINMKILLFRKYLLIEKLLCFWCVFFIELIHEL